MRFNWAFKGLSPLRLTTIQKVGNHGAKTETV